MSIKLSEQDDKIYWKLYYNDEVYKDIQKYGIENGMLKAACSGGHLQLAKYLLDTTNPEKKYVATIDFNNNCSFIAACENGKLHIVKFLIDYQQGPRSVNIYDQEDYGFRQALAYNKSKVTQFLLSYNPLKTQEDKTIQDKRFIILCKKNEIDLINFCIHDLNMEKNQYIIEQLEILKNMPKYKSIALQVENSFSMKDLNISLIEKFAEKEFKEVVKNKI